MHDHSFICVKKTKRVFVWYIKYFSGTEMARAYKAAELV